MIYNMYDLFYNIITYVTLDITINYNYLKILYNFTIKYTLTYYLR